jgi:hypothetical protein
MVFLCVLPAQIASAVVGLRPRHLAEAGTTRLGVSLRQIEHTAWQRVKKGDGASAGRLALSSFHTENVENDSKRTSPGIRLTEFMERQRRLTLA